MHNLCVVTFALVFISQLDFAFMSGKMMGGGIGLLLISNNKPDPLGNHARDTLIWNSHCGTGIMKDGGSKGKSILALPQCKKVIKKKKVVKEYIPIHVPVKEYIPVPMKMHGMDSMKIETIARMDSAMDRQAMMDTQKSEVYVPVDQSSKSRTKVVRKVKKVQRRAKMLKDSQ